jgi:hypothetical protein
MENKQLLAIAGLLALLQFVVKPLWLHINDNRQQLLAITDRLERADRLLQGAPEYQQQQQALAAQVQQVIANLPTYVSGREGQLRLQLQQGVEQQVPADLSLILFDWLSQETLLDNQLQSHQARITISGNPGQLMAFYMTAFAATPGREVKMLELQRSPFSSNPAAEPLTMLLIVQFLAVNQQQIDNAEPERND